MFSYSDWRAPAILTVNHEDASCAQGGSYQAREQELGCPPTQTHGTGPNWGCLGGDFTCIHATQASAAPSYHALQYKYVPDILEKRGPFREAHLGAARQKAEEGKIMLAGALAEPVDSALFIWKNSTQEEIEGFVTNDVYVRNGLVTEWSIRPYMVMVSQ